VSDEVEASLEDASLPTAASGSRRSPKDVTIYSTNQVGRIRELLTRMYAARNAIRFYSIDHPACESAIEALYEVIDRYFREGVEVEITFFEGEVFLGQQLLPDESVLFDQLIRELSASEVGSLIFRPGLDRVALARLLSILSSDPSTLQESGGVQRMISEAGISGAEVRSVKILESVDRKRASARGAHESYDDAISLLREIDILMRRNTTINSGMIKEVVRALVDNVVSSRYVMLELTGLKNYDEYTFYHSANVATLSLALGSTISSDSRFLQSLGTGALLHDIGKMTIDFEILNKPGPLTAAEWEAVKNHPITGARQAARIPGLDKSALVIIFEHHMRYDGNGYPTVVSRRTQHLASRIVAVADAFDAMTSRRTYSSARSQSEAMLALAKSADFALDPVLTRLFASILGIYPPRSVVRLSDGSIGIVMRPSEKDMLKPIVKVISDPASAMIEPYVVDLSNDSGITVRASLDAANLNIEVDDYL